MAESGSFNSGGYHGRYFEFNWWIEDRNSGGNWIRIGWNLIARSGSANWYYTKNVRVNIDGEEVFNAGSGKTKCYRNTTFASGSKTIWGASNKYFTASVNGDIYTYGTNNAASSGGWTLPTLAVSPTLPSWVNVSGGAGGNWVDKDNPTFNVSWGGANAGTYTINEYSIDVSRYGANAWWNTGSVYTSNWEGSATRSASGYNGGDSIQVRVGMKTSDGNWWGHSYWGKTLKVFSHPTAPTTFSSPTSVEIDQGFNLTWGGATAGSNGIAGYDMQARAFNGSSWTNWTDVFSCKNQTSYSISKIKDLTISGVNYSTNGAGVKFQYRIRTSDGIISTSGWKESNQIGITIYAPSAPRNSIINWSYI